ncbi:HET-domain-containing protein, partial [Glonium stellatum]
MSVLETIESGALFGGRSFHIRKASEYEPAWDGLEEASLISSHSSSDDCFTFAQSCPRDCFSNHKVCQQVSTTSLSKRVIDIGEDQMSIRLIEPKCIKAPYTALSHCWGDCQPLKSNRLNVHLRKEGIEWESLPRTFQDATTITRKIGLRYLRIDSLCILQDNDQDWETEPTSMGDVYRNAYLTIAATSASSGDIPFLTSRPDRYFKRLPFRFGDKRRPSTMIEVREIPDLDKDNNIGPLDRRAWAFQEYQLSTRILQYTEFELVWECREATYCECIGHKNNWHSCQRVASVHNINKPQKVWHNAVYEFLKRQMKFQSDKLPTLAGLAKIVSKSTGWNYCAGLGEENLVSDLVW